MRISKRRRRPKPDIHVQRFVLKDRASDEGEWFFQEQSRQLQRVHEVRRRVEVAYSERRLAELEGREVEPLEPTPRWHASFQKVVDAQKPREPEERRPPGVTREDLGRDGCIDTEKAAR